MSDGASQKSDVQAIVEQFSKVIKEKVEGESDQMVWILSNLYASQHLLTEQVRKVSLKLAALVSLLQEKGIVEKPEEKPETPSEEAPSEAQA